MERVLERDELCPLGAADPAPVPARKLQARLDRFRAAVAEERPRQPGQVGEPLRELGLQGVMEQIRRVDQRAA